MVHVGGEVPATSAVERVPVSAVSNLNAIANGVTDPLGATRPVQEQTLVTESAGTVAMSSTSPSTGQTTPRTSVDDAVRAKHVLQAMSLTTDDLGISRAQTVDDRTGTTTSVDGHGQLSGVSNKSLPSSARGRGRGRGRGGRGAAGGRRTSRGSKRKRNEDEIRADDSPSDTDPEDLIVKAQDDDTSSAANPSGRSGTKPAVTTLTGGTTKAAAALTGQWPMAGTKRKRQPMNRKNSELAVCDVCLRPHSPATNMIVFCDGCNTPFHRYCHHPPIAQEVVDVREMEWYCAECEADNEVIYDISMFVSAHDLPDDKRRAHLSRLPAPILVDLILRASRSNPDLPILPASFLGTASHPYLTNKSSTPGQDAPLTTKTSISNPTKTSTSTPTKASMPPPPLPRRTPTRPPHKPFSIPPSHAPDPHAPVQRPPDDELEESYDASDPPACYVRPGYGLAALLRPEAEDEAMLVDDNVDAYVHVVQVDPELANRMIFAAGPEGVADQGPGDNATKGHGADEMLNAVQVPNAGENSSAAGNAGAEENAGAGEGSGAEKGNDETVEGSAEQED